MSGARVDLDAVLEGATYRLEPLSGGCVGDVHLVHLDDGQRRVAKLDPTGAGGLETEAAMLRYLREHTSLPVPTVYHASPRVLLMQWISGRTGCGPRAEGHAAELLAELHAVRGERFGFDHATRIGGLEQPNEWRDSWLTFFAEQRLLPMARAAHDADRIDARRTRAIERIAARLDAWLDEPRAPALLHGDIWSGNVLSENGRVTGLLDPAISFGHPEIELAFTTLFSTFTDRFYVAYGAYAGRLDADFFELRRHLYNVYPLLVHVRLFGGSYVRDLDAILARFA